MKALRNVLALALAALLAQGAFAADYAAVAGCGADPAAANAGNACCCGNCGGCGKMCKLVSTTKKIVVKCYGVKEEQFCVPGPSCKGCTQCEHLCAQPGCPGDCEGGCRPDCRVRWTEWCPGGAEVHCRRKLVKYEAEKEIPWFKWVVVDCDGAGGCGPGCVCDPASGVMAVAPAPQGLKAGQEYVVSEDQMKALEARYGAPKMAAAPAPALVKRLPTTAPGKTPGARPSSQLANFVQ